MSQHFETPRLRIESAKEDLKKLVEALEAYGATAPYEHGIDPYSEPGYILAKVRVVKPPPLKIAHQCSRIAEDLRAALDTAISACAFANGAQELDNMCFPFCGSESKFNHKAKGVCKQVPPQIIQFIRDEVRPWPKGGKTSDVLRAVSAVAGQGKHIILRPNCNRSSTSMSLKIMQGGEVNLTNPTWKAKKNELTVARLRPGKHLKVDFVFNMYVAFGDVGGLEGQSVDIALRHMTAVVEQVVDAMEAEIDKLFP